MTTAADTTSPPSSAKLNVNLQELLNDLFLVLTQKESEVIKRRFAMTGQKQTLEKIGKHFNVTRERIRQIESIALSKLRRTVRTTRFDEVNDIAKGVLSASGGLMVEADLVSSVLKQIPSTNKVDGAILRLSFSIDNEMEFGSKTLTHRPFWRLTSLSMDDVNAVMKIS